MSAPNSREIYQCLRDAALGVQALDVHEHLSDGRVRVQIGHWRLILTLDDEGLAHCSECRAPDGREAERGHWQRYGTDPVELLSVWERTQLERLLG